jgi:5'-3' exonuclease|tara:strand:+ start:321 stop:1343 length:1023 start_codon:yes stop_codon:yes gene_type:complete
MSQSYKKILSNLKETPPRELNDHILVIDSMNTFIRSFSMLRAMNPQGHHIGGLVGFLRSLGYVTRIFDPTRIICVFDGKGSSVNRKNINPNYKAHRTNTRITNWGMFDSKAEEYESLAAQVDRLKDYLDCLPVQTLEMEKLEADDIIAYIALQASKSNKKVTIVSSDKDFLQLVNNSVEVYSPIKKATITENNVKDFIGVIPENYNIVKALLGDNSDGLSGVKGLGIKTIIKEFPLISRKPVSGLNYIYDVCEKKLEDKKIFAKILHNWDKVKTNFDLMNLHEGLLDNSEKNHIFDIIKEPAPSLQTGAFMHLLNTDKIEGITKNTEGWLQNFRGLTVFK